MRYKNLHLNSRNNGYMRNNVFQVMRKGEYIARGILFNNR